MTAGRFDAELKQSTRSRWGVVAPALAACLAISAFWPAAPLADEATLTIVGDSFTTADGHQLALPPIASLNCGEMRDLLRLIDSTNYRGLNPRPTNSADMPLFQYENELAAAHYEACANRPSAASSAPRGGAFTFSTAN